MSTRAIPKTSILDCLPNAADIANSQIINKDLDFIQTMIKQTDYLNNQAEKATDYQQLVTINDNFGILVERSNSKLQTLVNFTDKSNPLTEINNSEQLLHKIQTLSDTIQSQTHNLKQQFTNILQEKLNLAQVKMDEFNNQIANIANHQDVATVFTPLKNFISELEDNAQLLKSSKYSDNLLNNIEKLAQNFEAKAESFNKSFLDNIDGQINILETKIESLNPAINNINSSESAASQISQIKELSSEIGKSIPDFKSNHDFADLVQALNELSIKTHAKILDLTQGFEKINELSELKENPTELILAVKETALRSDLSVVKNQLMPLIDKPSELVTKLEQIVTQYSVNNIAAIDVSVIESIDRTISRLDSRLNVTESADPNSMSDAISELVNDVETKFDTVVAIDPITQTEFSQNYVQQISNNIDTSGFYLFFNEVQTIARETMMASRSCVDSAFKDFTRASGSFIESIFDPLLGFLTGFEQIMLATAWPIFLLIIGTLAWAGSRSLKITLVSVFSCFLVGFLNMWAPMISTITMISVATLLCLLIGIPLGVWMSRSDRTQMIITPMLDIMQTIPSFVYLIPVVMLLGIGKVPGLIAVCIYAMPPIIRLTNLGLRLVDKEAMEAADAFGATYRQRLFTVQIPLALPNIFAGINQTIMMALSMVVIASMIGVAGLGLPVLSAVQNQYLTLGLLNGLAIVALAIIFDRVSQEYGKRIQKHRAGKIL